MRFLKKWSTLLVSILLILVIVTLCLVGAVSIKKYQATIAEQQESMATMSSFIDNDIGPLVDCYVVNKSVRVGDKITEENLTAVSIPEKIAYTTKEIEKVSTDADGNEVKEMELEKAINVVTNINDVVGKQFRVSLNEGAVLLSDFVMDNKLDNMARYYELVMEDYPTTIKVGDYVDIRIQFTYGEDFIALSHRRVEAMNLETGMFTFVFNENDINLYNSMILDKAMYESVVIYMLAYVDSSSQTAAETYYPINKNISEILAINPNILDAVKQEITLKRQKMNSILGGNLETFDERKLERVSEYVESTRESLIRNKERNISERLRAEERAAEEAARANQ